MTTIVEYPTKSLKEVSKKVSRIEMMFNSDLTAIIGYMRDLVIKRPRAVGIAAPQLGYNKRIIAIRTNNVSRIMINPEIIALAAPPAPRTTAILFFRSSFP